MTHPDKTDKLVILNLPHPKGLLRELANNPAAAEEQPYARNFQKPDAASKVTPELLTFWVKDPEATQEVRRGVQAVEHGRDAQLLQGQLPARAVHLRRGRRSSRRSSARC